MSERLFPRDWKLRVDNIDVSALDLEFHVLRNNKPSPNRCTVVVWNLNPEHRAQLYKRNHPDGVNGKTVGVNVQLEAGYVGNTPVIFSGDLRELATVRQHTDWKTTLSVDDGGRAVRESRFSPAIQFAKGAPVGDVLAKACAAMGIGMGNSADFSATAQILGIGTKLPHGLTLEGSAHDGLKRVCDAIGVTCSIQGGVLQLLPRGKPLNVAAIRLSPDTGLIGSPEAAIDSKVSLGFAKTASGAKTTTQKVHRKDTSILKARALLIPGLVPGRVVQLDSDAFQGNYMISECEYRGQTWGTEWFVDMVLRVYA